MSDAPTRPARVSLNLVLRTVRVEHRHTSPQDPKRVAGMRYRWTIYRADGAQLAKFDVEPEDLAQFLCDMTAAVAITQADKS